MDFISNTPWDQEQMLASIGIHSLEALIESIVPRQLRLKRFDLPEGLAEQDLKNLFRTLARQNRNTFEYPSYLGAGAYDHFIPSVVDHMLLRGEFYTAYTPYQPEASQGTLQAVFEYQSLVAELTGMEVVNASMYDGASATAEACLTALNLKEGRSKILVARSLHPSYRQVIATYLSAQPVTIIEIPYDEKEGALDLDALEAELTEDVACCVVQSPNFFGVIEPMKEISEQLHAVGALFVSVVYPVSLGLLAPPGDYAADIACGEGQSLGNRLFFGGPYLGFFASKMEYVRKMPGRLVGQTTDREGRRGFVLTLQTREQHIRREKATSNICTNQGLCALAAAIYLSALGKEGIQEVADHNLQKSHYLAERLARIPEFRSRFRGPLFNEFVMEAKRATTLHRLLLKRGILGPLSLAPLYPELKDCLLFCVTETKTRAQLDQLLEILKQ